MAEGSICGKCHRGLIQNGKCTQCGFQEPGRSAGNALPVGHVLHNGRYRIEQVLGEGGYGITYVVWDRQERRRVALKEFFPRRAMQRGKNRIDTVCINPAAEIAVSHARIRFHEEAALLLMLKNVKEVVDVYHSFEENKTAYYTMELLSGMDMQQYLRTYGRMSWQKVGPIVIQIIRALHASHEMGYIHRDVTPDNVFLLRDGSVRLIDFGNARRFRTNQQLTAVVKDKFAPREQYDRNGNQGPWTDIYSLCVTIYYAITGMLPPKATERAGEDALPPLFTETKIPREVSDAVRVGMSAEEDRRYQTIFDFACAMFPGKNILGWSDKKVVQLVCTQGIMQGLRMQLPTGQTQSLGRGVGNTIQYPTEAGGISRNQCSILLHTNGTVYVRDENSRYGTCVNGTRLVSGQWKALQRKDRITFGKEEYMIN